MPAHFSFAAASSALAEVTQTVAKDLIATRVGLSIAPPTREHGVLCKDSPTSKPKCHARYSGIKLKRWFILKFK
jgi:hypothetical protein